MMGFLMTIIFMILILSFLVSKVTLMYDFEYDTYSSLTMGNQFSEEFNDFKLKDFKFLPSFDIELINQENGHELDIWNNHTSNKNVSHHY